MEKLNEKKCLAALIELEKAIDLVRAAGLYDRANALDDLYDSINQELCETMEQETEIKE